MFSPQGSSNSMLQNSTWNGNEGMVTSIPVDSSVSQILESRTFLYTNTDTINAPYAENSDNVNRASPTNRPFTASSEPTQTLNTALRSSLVPIQPSISPQTTSERSSISHEKVVVTMDEIHNIDNDHSVNTTTTDNATPNASNNSIRLPPTLRPAAAVIPIQPATTPPSSPGRQRCGRKRKAESLEEKEFRTKQRVLRNRQAAQMSRNKKRQQLVDLEQQNTALRKEREIHEAEIAAYREENERLAKRLRTVETKLEDVVAEIEMLRSERHQQQVQPQNTLPSPEMIIHSTLDGVRGSAASVTLEYSPLASGNGKNETVNVRTHHHNTTGSFYRFESFEPSMHENSKSLQRTVMLRSLYRTLSQIPSKLVWKQILIIFLIMSSTSTSTTCYLPCSDKTRKMEFADNVVISELVRRLYEKRRLRSVKGKRNRGPSNMKSGEYEWRKYPP